MPFGNMQTQCFRFIISYMIPFTEGVGVFDYGRRRGVNKYILSLCGGGGGVDIML